MEIYHRLLRQFKFARSQNPYLSTMSCCSEKQKNNRSIKNIQQVFARMPNALSESMPRALAHLYVWVSVSAWDYCLYTSIYVRMYCSPIARSSASWKKKGPTAIRTHEIQNICQINSAMHITNSTTDIDSFHLFRFIQSWNWWKFLLDTKKQI